ncbi:hypothetical protein [Pseudonocardia kunmingensis]|uniref:Uncharacterized protein n=1 Tax=Pseudonocardia kunmingensis TaxID=630975 RepID=A0A543DI22_9PSEU|nr:hypothetical protein [Pseudonocardia kunmingensis]TQM08972.1 hypothetical protein FB558_4713 [Pseudonocardia kunmingensis]
MIGANPRKEVVGPMAAGAWDQYLAWNAAISETVFTEEQAGQPVYLDMDDAVMAKVSSRLKVSADDAHGELVQAVRATLGLGGAQWEIFWSHLQHLRRWRHAVAIRPRDDSATSPPPTVALLAAFTLAAEAMGSDSNAAVNAYYPRLAAILGVIDERPKERLQTAYMASAEQLWRSLNDWLTITDGRYGIPTAYAVTHRYIGLPLSQALIRAADRRHLEQMFRQFGLAPGSDVPPTDMQRMLDTWIQQVPSPASKNLQNLWQRPGTQERIAEVASNELAAWEGRSLNTEHDDQAARRGSIRLIARLKTFPRSDLQLSFLASIGKSVPDELVVESAAGRPKLEMLPSTGGAIPRPPASIDPGSFIEGVLHLSDPASGLEARRHPRRVVVLRRDEQTNAFVEVERVQLGEDFLVLVKTEGPQLKQVEQLLTLTARPGFKEESRIRGLPDGWVLFTAVQILAAPTVTPQHPDLNALVPVISSQLSIAGGLKLPGNLRKWSSLSPPEIRAVSQVEGRLDLSLARLDIESGEADEPRTWHSERGVLLVALEDLELEDGEYETVLSGGGRSLQRSVLRLRSSDSPDSWTWGTAAKQGYDLSVPLGALRATPGANPHSARGCKPPATVGRQPIEPLQGLGKIWWSANRPPRPAAVPIVIASPDPTSCVVTGAHRIKLPPTPAGRPTAPMLSGECTQCGIVKRYPAWPRRARRLRTATLEVEEHVKLDNLSEARAESITHDTALDALVHVGGGTASSLDKIVAQVDSSLLGADAFKRSLEMLGHIDVSRSDRLEPTAWSIAPACVVEATDETYFLSGAWSAAAQTQVEEAVIDFGGKFTYAENPGGPLTWFIEGLGEEQVRQLIAQVQTTLPMRTHASLVGDAAMGLVRALPKLSEVEKALPRVPLSGARRIERFNVDAAYWEQVQTAASPGAYRLESVFRTAYYFRSPADVELHQGALGTAQLVKHLEAQRLGRSLLGFYPAAGQLAVALGSDLPGLYGRAAVMNSGRLPGKSTKRRALIYHDVTPEFADYMSTLLVS